MYTYISLFSEEKQNLSLFFIEKSAVRKLLQFYRNRKWENKNAAFSFKRLLHFVEMIVIIIIEEEEEEEEKKTDQEKKH